MPSMTTLGSPFGALAVIADPRAGGGSVAARLGELERALDARGLAYRLQVADDETGATQLARRALGEGYRYLAAVGDDRTVQDVVNGMFEDGRPIIEDPVLAVLPADTGCDLVRSFGLPGDIEAASTHLLGDTTYPFDVVKLQVVGDDGRPVVRYAHNVAEVGLHAAAWRSRARLPRFLGNGRRFLGFWSAYVRSRPRDLRVGADAKTHELRAWSVIVGNGQFTDGGMRLSPRSFPGDGVLDALVFTGPKSDAYRLLPRMFRHGDHVPDGGITELRAKLRLSIEADRPLPVVADGAYLGMTPAAFQLVPRSILLKL
jgi:diacylglycerol kinase (ATP)